VPDRQGEGSCSAATSPAVTLMSLLDENRCLMLPGRPMPPFSSPCPACCRSTLRQQGPRRLRRR
jgi:hypothetical protein